MHSVKTTVSILLVLLLLAPVAWSKGQEVSGEGWRLFLPVGFQAAPRSVGAQQAEQVRSLVSSVGIPLAGAPKSRAFVRLGTEGEQARILVMRYRLLGGDSVRSVSELDVDALRRSLELTARGDGHLEVQHVDRARINSATDGIRVTVMERNPDDGSVAEYRFALVIGSGSAVVVVFQSRGDAGFDATETWKRLLVSLRVTRPDARFQSWFALGAGLMGLSMLAIIGAFVWRRRRVEPTYVMAIDPMAPGAGDAMHTGSRAADGLPIVTSEQAAAPTLATATRSTQKIPEFVPPMLRDAPLPPPAQPGRDFGDL